jgi:hypothetical protein
MCSMKCTFHATILYTRPLDSIDQVKQQRHLALVPPLVLLLSLSSSSINVALCAFQLGPPASLSLRISTTKLTAPTATPNKISSQLMHRPLTSLGSVLAGKLYSQVPRPHTKLMHVCGR